MNKITADRLNKIEPSPTLAITALAAQLKAEGKDIIGFGAGEPDFDTPEHIKDAAKKALDEGFTKYCDVSGLPDLKTAICDWYKNEYNLLFQKDQIIVSTGGKQALYNLFLSIINIGEEVIIPAPYWVSYKDMVMLAEGNPVIVQTTFTDGYKLTADALEKAITSKTKAIILNSPSNPTGAVYSQDEMQRLAAVLEKHENILIITDDIYDRLLYDDQKFFNIPMVSEKLRERSIIVNGFSKTYSMTGWRLGYALSERTEIIKAMAKLQGQSTSNATTFAQKGAIDALTSSQSCVEEMKRAFVERRDFIVDSLSKCPGINVVKPGGAFYVFPDFEELSKSDGFLKLKKENAEETSHSKLLTKLLLEKYLVAIVPGIAFGYDNGFRMSYASSLDNIKKGMERIHECFNNLYK
ncbi:MAG: pyridoxal phosphate-dependent aminotransferase [Spirochaetia bacterium]|nr:pyridoxal phosphate-dependent aminotransferase [Spirochaetia bacterium]